MSTRIENIRYEILHQCYGYRPHARDCDAMVKLAKRDGTIPQPTEHEFETECAYLVGKGMLTEERDPMAQARKRFAITSAGIDHLESRGFD